MSVSGGRRRVNVVSVGLMLSFLAGCQKNDQLPRNLLLLTLDTTRADSLSCSGTSGGKTPHLDRLAAEGVRFESAYTSTPVTLPSHASILTGTYPIYHGARDNGGYRLEKENETIAEILRRRGYSTAAFIASFPLDSRFGLDQGFQVYDDDLTGGTQSARYTYRERRANQVVDSALKWIKRVPEETPFFCWVHFFDPHFPYDPPSATRGTNRDPYLDEITFMDSEIGRLLGQLESDDRLDETLIIVVGDHGEGREKPHEEKTHGVFLYEETMRVPLLMHHPRTLPSRRVVEESVSVVDIVPTALEILGVPGPTTVHGRSAMQKIAGVTTGPEPDRIFYLETLHPHHLFGWSALCGVRSGPWKYIRGPMPELYHLEQDPAEQNNLALRLPDRVADLSERLATFRTTHGRDLSKGFGRHRIDAAEARTLRELGYLAADTKTDDGLGGDPLDFAIEVGKDPKDLISVVDMIDESNALRESGAKEEAIQVLNKVVQLDPQNCTGLESLGLLLGELERHAEAERAYRKVLRVDPNRGSALYGVGRSLDGQAGERAKVGNQSGERSFLERAEKMYARAVRADPLHTLANLNLGNCFYRKKQYKEAIGQYRKAIELEPDNLPAHRNLGVALLAVGSYEESLPELVYSVERSPKDPSLHYSMAQCLEGLGRFRKAQEILKRLAAASPNHPAVKKDLARVAAKIRGS